MIYIYVTGSADSGTDSGSWRIVGKDSVGNYLAGWSATKSQSVIPVCDPEYEEFWGCHMPGNVMCFQSGEEDMKISGSVADSSGYHILPKPEFVLDPWNCSR